MSCPPINGLISKQQEFSYVVSRLRAWTSPVVSRDSVDSSETDELQTTDDDINDWIGLVVNDLWS